MRRFFKQTSRSCLISLFTCVIFVLGSMLVPAQQLHAAGNTYYVATYGNNNNPGTITQPWLTIMHATQKATAGDTIYVRGGIYYENISFANSGTEGSWITLKNYPGESPVIDGTNMVDPGYQNGIINLTASYLHIEGFELKNSQYYNGVIMWSTTGNSNIYLKDLVIHDTWMSGICISALHQASPITNVTIDGCEVYNCNQMGSFSDENISLINVDGFEIMNCHTHNNLQEGIDVKCGSKNGVIHHNEVEGSPSVGIYVDGFDRSQSNIDVYCNKVHHNQTGMALGCELSSGNSMTDINFYNNLIYNNTEGGWVVWPLVKGYNNNFEKTFTLVNNTFYLNAGGQIYIGQESEYQTGCVVRNNICVGANDFCVLIQYDDYASGGVIIDHNLFYALDGSYNAYNKYGTDYIYDKDPLLVNPVSDFRISSDSPARDNGSSNLAPTFDFAGISRPKGSGFDIGAYETVTDSFASHASDEEVMRFFGALPLFYLAYFQQTCMLPSFITICIFIFSYASIDCFVTPRFVNYFSISDSN